MTTHHLQGRKADDLLWFQRRSFLQGAAAFVAAGGAGTLAAQQRSNIVELRGAALLNGLRLTVDQFIQSGDTVQTGPGSTLTFVVGNSAFHVRENSLMTIERGVSLSAISLLRLVSGAVASVWGKGTSRTIVTPTMTAGIRGTGVYTEVFANQDNRSYFCNCYGVVEMAAGRNKALSQSSYHQAFWGEAQAKDGRWLTPAAAINHTDEELEFLARLVNQQTAWQVMGKKGIKDGKGYMEDKPGQMHPAQAISP